MRSLKAVNASRSQFFYDNVLSLHSHQGEDFDKFVKETQKKLKEDHNQDLTTHQIKLDLFKKYNKGLNDSIWSFLSELDKRDIKLVKNLSIKKGDLEAFIKWLCAKLKEFADYAKSKSNKAVSEEIHVLHSFLARKYGWTYEYMQEMDQVELLKAIEQSVIQHKREAVDNINTSALAGAYVAGSKQAKSKIDSLNKDATSDYRNKMIEQSNPPSSPKKFLSRKQLQKIMETKNG